MKINSSVLLPLSLLASGALGWRIGFEDLRDNSDFQMPRIIQCNHNHPECLIVNKKYKNHDCLTITKLNLHLNPLQGMGVDSIAFSADKKGTEVFSVFENAGCRGTPFYTGDAGTHKFRSNHQLRSFKVYQRYLHPEPLSEPEGLAFPVIKGDWLGWGALGYSGQPPHTLPPKKEDLNVPGSLNPDDFVESMPGYGPRTPRE